MDYEHIVHPLRPLYDSRSKVLILGSFPSPKSREEGFFYGNPQNRFWKVMAMVLDEDVPKTIKEKKDMLLRNHIALYDAIYSCDIIGASDSSIRNVVASDLDKIISASRISHIFCNGQKAYGCYVAYQEKKLGMKAVALPSTSPANAQYGMDRLYDEWKTIYNILNGE